MPPGKVYGRKDIIRIDGCSPRIKFPVDALRIYLPINSAGIRSRQSMEFFVAQPNFRLDLLLYLGTRY